MTHKTFKSLILTALLAGGAIPVACAPIQEEKRETTADRIARPAFMVDRKLNANGIDLQLWERIHQRYSSADVYIEGDGDSHATTKFAGGDPSPVNPVALDLASRDLAKNVVYIARPCQYRESPDQKACPQALWSTRRYSPEVIAAYNAALDEIKKRNDITDFNLIGYDGGANIAAALASERTDVTTLRTVAGVLNPSLVYDAKKDPLDGDSFSAMSVAGRLATLPQHHFIGAGDTTVAPAVYHSYRQAIGDSNCVHYSFVQDADHERGWVEKWPDLLKQSVNCPGDVAATPDNGQIFIPTTPLPPVPTALEKP